MLFNGDPNVYTNSYIFCKNSLVIDLRQIYDLNYNCDQFDSDIIQGKGTFFQRLGISRKENTKAAVCETKPLLLDELEKTSGCAVKKGSCSKSNKSNEF
jgi:hypothetical protein